jgi:hypothetical protein
MYSASKASDHVLGVLGAQLEILGIFVNRLLVLRTMLHRSLLVR